MEPGGKNITELTDAHLEAVNPECRWCFAIDLERVEGKVIAQYDFPDAMLLHLSCPRCGGEFTQYFEGWEETRVIDIIHKLHPDLKYVEEGLLKKINIRIFPEYLSDEAEI